MSLINRLLSVVSYIWTHPSNRRTRLRTLARAAAWQVYKRLTGGYWEVPLTSNRILRCHPNNTSASSVLYARLFDYNEMHFLLRYLHAEDNFLDVGANVGVYTILASSVVTRGAIHAFEPSTQARVRLEENIRINRLSNVEIHPVAVSDFPGELRLTRTKDSANYLVTADTLEETEKVVAVRLDDEVGSIRFAMGKMDIEGAELLAMRGAVRMLEVENPPVWLLEVSDGCRRFGYSKQDLIELLRKFGYLVTVYAADQNRLIWGDDHWRSNQNVLLIAESWRGEVEKRLARRSVC